MRYVAEEDFDRHAHVIHADISALAQHLQVGGRRGLHFAAVFLKEGLEERVVSIEHEGTRDPDLQNIVTSDRWLRHSHCFAPYRYRISRVLSRILPTTSEECGFHAL